ncbi:hypothetical protein, partial [Aliarcobacter cryaerophilus]|uniref:hypothetical protein n=1 Tax=Aliarcobacter cryaerophilus TaxID=28198 RepID=UPI0021B1BA03
GYIGEKSDDIFKYKYHFTKDDFLKWYSFNKRGIYWVIQRVQFSFDELFSILTSYILYFLLIFCRVRVFIGKKLFNKKINNWNSPIT